MAALRSLHRLAQKIGLIDAIDQRLAILKIHLPYSDSDHSSTGF